MHVVKRQKTERITVEEIKEIKPKNWRERALFGHLSNSNPLNFLYPCLFVTRIAFHVSIFALWHLDGEIQLLFVSLLSILMLGYIASFKPFKNRVRNQLAIINETTLVVACMTLFPFVFPQISNNHFLYTGKLAGGFILTMILISVVWGFLYILWIFIKKCRAKAFPFCKK